MAQAMVAHASVIDSWRTQRRATPAPRLARAAEPLICTAEPSIRDFRPGYWYGMEQPRLALDLARIRCRSSASIECRGNRPFRANEWKFVAVRSKPWELYDLEADRTEWNDLASKYPETVAALSTRWDDWARRSNVVPYIL
jgi:hypothetical protein